eukprot:1141949-Pelagomonas_calceolata.AAC.3
MGWHDEKLDNLDDKAADSSKTPVLRMFAPVVEVEFEKRPISPEAKLLGGGWIKRCVSHCAWRLALSNALLRMLMRSGVSTP